MTGPERPPVARTLLAIPVTGGRGAARPGAITALAGALGCPARSRDPLTGRRHRSAQGDYCLTIWGPAPPVAWLSQALPGIIASPGRAAGAATRRAGEGLHPWYRASLPGKRRDHRPGRGAMGRHGRAR